MKVFIFANPKGGVGKTTLAIATINRLRKKYESVLVLDTDPQQSLIRCMPEFDNVVVHDKVIDIEKLYDKFGLDANFAIVVDTIGALSFDNPAADIISVCAQKGIPCTIVIPFNISNISTVGSFPFAGSISRLFSDKPNIQIYLVPNNTTQQNKDLENICTTLKQSGLNVLPPLYTYLDIARLKFLDKVSNPRSEENLNNLLNSLL